MMRWDLLIPGRGWGGRTLGILCRDPGVPRDPIGDPGDYKTRRVRRAQVNKGVILGIPGTLGILGTLGRLTTLGTL